MKEEFIRLYNENIKREGADAFLKWLSEQDFFTAPASTRFHGAYEGGLLKHSINVAKRLEKECEADEALKSISKETIYLCGLLHDVCKINIYQAKKKTEDGEEKQKTSYTVKDKFPYGHGEKSVYIISQFMQLSETEALAIRWHMGAFDNSVMGGSYSFSGALQQCPLVLALHTADMKATYFDER